MTPSSERLQPKQGPAEDATPSDRRGRQRQDERGRCPGGAAVSLQPCPKGGCERAQSSLPPSTGISESPDPPGATSPAAGPRRGTAPIGEPGPGAATEAGPPLSARPPAVARWTAAPVRPRPAHGGGSKGCRVLPAGAGLRRAGRRLLALPGTDALDREQFGSGCFYIFLLLLFIIIIFNALSDRDRCSLPADGGGGPRPRRELGRSPGWRGAPRGVWGRLRGPGRVLPPSECRGERQQRRVRSDGHRRQASQKPPGAGGSSSASVPKTRVEREGLGARSLLPEPAPVLVGGCRR